MRFLRRLLIGVVVTVGLGGILVVLLLIPGIVVDWLSPGVAARLRLDAVAALRLHLLYFLGGMIAVITLVYAHLRHRRESAQLDLERKRSTNERFGTAVEQLAHGASSVRLGAIYTFQHVAVESHSDRAAVGMLLRAFVQQSSRADPPTDVSAETQAAMEVLAAPPLVTDGLAFHDVSLRGLNLRGGEIRGLQLEGADLTYSSIVEADVRNASLIGSNLADARWSVVGESVFEFSNLANAGIVTTGDLRFVACDLSGLTITIRVPEERARVPRLAFSECVIDGLEVHSVPRRVGAFQLDVKNSAWDDERPPRFGTTRVVRTRVVGAAEVTLREYIRRVVRVAEGRETSLPSLADWLGRTS